ncbi:MAG: DUF1178 family protein [Betaproteobacteria bacterium]|nr:DUF1178 family protein [Betaproteobacteria bacterium]
MIVYDLICAAEHRFEAWFASAEDFEQQAGTPMLTCPLCGSDEVRRVPAGIHVAKHGHRENAPAPPPDHGHVAAFSDPKNVWAALRKILSSSENVGQRFPEEARRIHYGEAPKRSIRGEASSEEAQALRDEGIEVLSLPIPPTEDLH